MKNLIALGVAAMLLFSPLKAQAADVYEFYKVVSVTRTITFSALATVTFAFITGILGGFIEHGIKGNSFPITGTKIGFTFGLAVGTLFFAGRFADKEIEKRERSRP